MSTPATPLLARRTPLERLPGVVSVASIVMGLTSGGGALIYGQQAQYVDEAMLIALVYTPVTLLLFGVVGLLCTQAISKGRLVTLMRITFVYALALTLLVFMEIWTNVSAQRGSISVFGNLAEYIWPLLAMPFVALVIVGQMFVTQVKSLSLELARRGVALSVILLCATAIANPYVQFSSASQEIFARIMGVWSTSTFLALVVVGMLLKQSKKPRKQANESLPSRISLRMTCPNCNEEQTLSTGLSHCKSCKYTVLIEVDEPRCECGYLVYKLQSDTCPECGRIIEQSQRWDLPETSSHTDATPTTETTKTTETAESAERAE